MDKENEYIKCFFKNYKQRTNPICNRVSQCKVGKTKNKNPYNRNNFGPPLHFEREKKKAQLNPYMSKVLSSGGLGLLLAPSGTLKLSIGGGAVAGDGAQCGGGTEKLEPEAS